MKEKFNNILKYGAFISLPTILLSVIGYVFRVEDSRAYGWISILIFIITIFFVQRLYRDDYLKGIASYGKMLGHSMLLILVAAFIIFVYSLIFYKFIAPEYIEKLLTLVDDELYSKGLSDSEIEMSMSFIRVFYTPLGLGVTAFFSTIFQGFIISLITSIFNKRKVDGFSEAMKDIKQDSE